MQEHHSNFKKKRLRTFFHHQEAVHQYSDTLEDIENQLVNMGMTYIQMRLPIDNITKNLEISIRDTIPKEIQNSKIREANEKDLKNIMHLYNNAWSTAHTPFSIMTLDALKEIYDYSETTLLIAEHHETYAGFAILDIEGPNFEYGIISGLGILPRFQRSKIGTLLGLKILEFFKLKGVTELRCEVYIENLTSYNFIKSLRFEEYDRKTYTMQDFMLKYKE